MLILYRSLGRVTLCMTLVLFSVSASAYGEVVATPNSVTFHSTTQTHEIDLSQNGKPVPASDILGWQLLASKHDYHYFLDYQKRDGVLVLTPSKLVEVGSYDLVIRTRAGNATVKVYTPLTEMADIIEKTAMARGITQQEARDVLGLTTPRAQSIVKIDLPPVYYEGQTLNLTMPPSPDTEYVWKINGEIVQEGLGNNTLVYTFPSPGEYILTYTEKRAGSVVAETVAQTCVAPLPAVRTEVARGVSVTFEAPGEHTQCTWMVDGDTVGTMPVLKYTFTEPGEHLVECIASDGADDPEGTYIRTYRKVSVR